MAAVQAGRPRASQPPLRGAREERPTPGDHLQHGGGLVLPVRRNAQGRPALPQRRRGAGDHGSGGRARADDRGRRAGVSGVVSARSRRDRDAPHPAPVAGATAVAVAHLGCLLPDVIDKPIWVVAQWLGAESQQFDTARMFGHTAFLAFVVAVAAWRGRASAIGAMAFGVSPHPPLGVVYGKGSGGGVGGRAWWAFR